MSLDSLPSVDCDVLIVRGVDSTDGLQALGLPMAARYQRAHTVILVPDSRPPIIIKERAEDRNEHGWTNVRFFDVDSRLDVVGRGLRRLENAHARAQPRGGSHAAVGMFLF